MRPGATADPRQLNSLFDRQRILFYCGMLLALELTVCLLLLIGGSCGLFGMKSGPSNADFISFYAAGGLTDAGTPQLAYDRSAHLASEQAAAGAGTACKLFYYPPPFLLLCAASGRLPYAAALAAFEGVTLALYLLVMRCILAVRGWAVLVPLLAFPEVLWALLAGQNAFLTAACSAPPPSLSTVAR